MELTEAKLLALRSAPFVGFPLGSNMWPLVALYEGEEGEVWGEEFDELLRAGLLEARQLPSPVLTDRTPDPEYAPDCECTHDIVLTSAGEAALASG